MTEQSLEQKANSSSSPREKPTKRRETVLETAIIGGVGAVMYSLMLGNVAVQESWRGICWVAGYQCEWVDHDDSSFGHYEVVGRISTTEKDDYE